MEFGIRSAYPPVGRAASGLLGGVPARCRPAWHAVRMLIRGHRKLLSGLTLWPRSSEERCQCPHLCPTRRAMLCPPALPVSTTSWPAASPRRRLFLVEGVPGSGKTTLALQYLMAGAKRGEPGLYVTLSETEEELVAGAASHGWVLDGIEIRELTPPEGALDPDEQNTMFHPSEVELAVDHQADPGGRRAAEADARRLRFALGAAAPGRQRAALSPADPGAEAVLRRRASARCSCSTT